LINKAFAIDENNEADIVRNDTLQVIESPEGKIIDFYLINEITDIKNYLDFLRQVESARSNDTIRIHINNYGGNVDVAWNIYDALRQSKADVDVSVEGACASAASMIMLAGNSWSIFPHSWVMVHAWSGWIVGKWNEQQADMEFSKKVREPLFRDMYKNFLEPEEIDLCLAGKDYYFGSEETIKRLEKYQADAVKKQEAIQAVAAKYQDIMNKEIEEIMNSDTTPDTEKDEDEKSSKKSKK